MPLFCSIIFFPIEKIKPLKFRGFFATILFCAFAFGAKAQNSFDCIATDFAIKEIFPDGARGLSKGKVYYSLQHKQLVYRTSFPEENTIVVTDTSITIFTKGRLLKHESFPGLTASSIFHLALTGNLEDFGLEESPFELVETTKDDGLVLSRWQLPFRAKGKLKAFELAQKDGQLHGIISYAAKDKVISKQQYLKYQRVMAFSFPAEVLELKYDAKGVHKKQTNYTNIRVNKLSNENSSLYHIEL